MTLEGQYEYYRCVQHDFTEAYKMVDSYVRDLYVLPKKFMENTGPALDKYIKGYQSNTSSGLQITTPYETVLDFIDQLDEFTEDTLQLFEEHKIYSEKRAIYLKKVENLKARSNGKIVSEFAVDFIELTPEVSELQKGLKQIKLQADQIVDKLERLELKWESLRVNARA